MGAWRKPRELFQAARERAAEGGSASALGSLPRSAATPAKGSLMVYWMGRALTDKGAFALKAAKHYTGCSCPVSYQSARWNRRLSLNICRTSRSDRPQGSPETAGFGHSATECFFRPASIAEKRRSPRSATSALNAERCCAASPRAASSRSHPPTPTWLDGNDRRSSSARWLRAPL